MNGATTFRRFTFLIIADDEGVLRDVPERPADILISCGDLSDGTILKVAQRCGCREIVAVKGNHDSSGPFPSPIRDLHLNIFNFEGMRFGGFCGAWKYKPKGNYLFEQNEVEEQLANFPHLDFFVAHNSPRNVHDRDDDVHIGFSAFNRYMARTNPVYVFHGHQHQNVETVVEGVKVICVYGHRFVSFNVGSGRAAS